jgi:hypothetical protein
MDSDLATLGVTFQKALNDTFNRVKSASVDANSARIFIDLNKCQQVYFNVSTTLQTFKSVDDFFYKNLKIDLLSLIPGKTEQREYSQLALKAVRSQVEGCLKRLEKINSFLDRKVSHEPEKQQ